VQEEIYSAQAGGKRSGVSMSEVAQFVQAISGSGVVKTESRPQKIREIEIDGVKYDLAKNGKVYLVEHKQDDFYGRPVAEEVEMTSWVFGVEPKMAMERIQGLLNLLGEYAGRVQAQRDARLERGKEE
jgi:hypothetical protein